MRMFMAMLVMMVAVVIMMRMRDYAAIGQRMAVLVPVRVDGFVANLVEAGFGAAAFLAHKI
jgi:hypothetical protein